MSNVAVRKQNGGQNLPAPASAFETGFEPIRMLRDLMRFDPFREMSPFANEAVANFMPAFEVKETKDSYVFKADVPGVKASDLEIHMTGNRLSISGKREAEHQEKSDTYYAYERTYGHFTRVFTMPAGADGDHIHAELNDGVLKVAVPKAPEMQPKKVAIQTADKAKS